MLNQFDLSEYLALFTGVGSLIVLIAFIIITIIVALKIWAWAIKKRRGRVTGLGDVLITLLVGFILGAIASYVVGLFLDPNIGYTIGAIVAFLVEVLVISNRHHMSFIEALIATILAFIAFIFVFIILVIVLVIIVVVAFGINLI